MRKICGVLFTSVAALGLMTMTAAAEDKQTTSTPQASSPKALDLTVPEQQSIDDRVSEIEDTETKRGGIDKRPKSSVSLGISGTISQEITVRP